jgi:hypothetical protein
MIADLYSKAKAWFKNSTTILWARLQVFGAAVWVVLIQTDLAPLLSQKWLTGWLIFSGLVTELTRRRSLPPAA